MFSEKTLTKINLNKLIEFGLLNYKNGNLIEAKYLFEKVIKVDSKNEHINQLLGIISVQNKEYQKAIEYFGKVIKVNAFNALNYVNRGNAYLEINDLENAEINYIRALKLDPNYAEAYCYLAVLQAKKMLFDEAIDNLKKSININPKNFMAYYNLGNIYAQIKNYEQAQKEYFVAIQINPDYAQVYSSLANIYQKIAKNKLALKYYNIAISKNQKNPEIFYNKGNLCEKLENYEEAIQNYDKAIGIDNLYAQAYWNKALIQLGKKQYEDGWKNYEWRWQQDDFNQNIVQTTIPKLSEINTGIIRKKILLIAEQGIGDQILYLSLLNDLMAINISIVVMVNEKLISILKNSFPDILFCKKEKIIRGNNFDYYLWLGDLGKLFRNSITDFESQKKYYLIADKFKTDLYRNRIKKNNNSKIICGITWRSINEKIGEAKTIQLIEFLPLLKIKNIAFVNLQYGDCKNEIQEFENRYGANIINISDIDQFNDLCSHASLINACDIVVTISNTTAHLAGALGKKTFLLCSKGNGQLWYWFNENNGKSIWYPSVEIHMKKYFQSWSKPIEEIKVKLENINEIK